MPNEDFERAQTHVLDHFRVAAESRYVDIPAIDGRAHVLVVGEGRPVVLLNGIGCPAAMWAPLMAELSGYRLFAIDLPGCGLSGGAIVETATVRQQSVGFLEQALDGLDLDAPAFIGNSMGSLWSMWFALAHPERVAAAVHIGAPALLLGTSAPLPMRFMSVPAIGRLMWKLQPPSIARMDQTAAMVRVELEREPEVRAVMVESERMPDAQASFLSLLHACVRVRGARPSVAISAAQLEALAHPIRFVWAEDDPFASVEVGRRATELVPDADLHVVPGGHAPWVNAPNAVGDLVRDFLVTLRSSAASATGR